MWVGLITLFPEMFSAISDYGVSGRALKQGQVTMKCWNPRDFTTDKHRTVDDRPYGGGPGMLMKTEPLEAAVNEAKIAAKEAARPAETKVNSKVIYLSPQGQPLTQKRVQELAKEQSLILLCGRYEGVDERFIETCVDEEISLGDYVLSGGEVPAMALIDAIIRLQPGVLGHEQSAEQDSFTNGLLDCPHYTRPEKVDENKVPGVLLSGDHAQIARWRLKQSLGRTWLRRPELLKSRGMNEIETGLLKEFLQENGIDNSAT